MLKPNLINIVVATALGVVAAPVLALDTGDAPQSYGDATHEVVTGSPQLGQNAPDNNGPAFGPFADGDDGSEAIDDEDGVFGFPTLVQNGKAYTTNVFVQNSTGSPATLAGWIDFDGNGTFDADEYATAEVPASAPGENVKVKLVWNSLSGVTSDFFGPSFARFRISSQEILAENATGYIIDGEVEDYTVEIQADYDGDEIPDTEDLDNDNDGIPDSVEGTADTDGDTTPDTRDFDSDNDSIADFIEAGNNPSVPVDTDGDGAPDYLDLDSNNDGIPDSQPASDDTDADRIPDSQEGNGDDDGDGVLNINDIDSDNDTIPDAIEFGAGPNAADTDSDGTPDFLDLDSDNDGIPDIYESHILTLPLYFLDADNDGRVDSNLLFGVNGLADDVETDADTGYLIYAVADSDGDALQDFRDLDSDSDGITDALEGGAIDNDNDGIVDDGVDNNGDGWFDGTINYLALDGAFPDYDNDVLPDFQDQDSDGSQNGPANTSVNVPTNGGTGNPTSGGGTNNEPAVIQTGLQGIAGCSVAGHGKEGALSMMALLSLVMLSLRRRKPKAQSID